MYTKLLKVCPECVSETSKNLIYADLRKGDE